MPVIRDGKTYYTLAETWEYLWARIEEDAHMVAREIISRREKKMMNEAPLTI